MSKVIPLLLAIIVSSSGLFAQKRSASLLKGFLKEESLEKLNKLRRSGCYCGNEFKPPAGPLSWNDKLVKSAKIQAKMMKKYNYFGHIGPDGFDIVDKMEMVDYKWHFAGENLGEGQQSFHEVLIDWIESKSHCDLLMNPDMEEMGIIKSGNYWVLHMGKQLPPGTKRIREYYSEGD
jgi:uncharacterized protein YkwD